MMKLAPVPVLALALAVPAWLGGCAGDDSMQLARAWDGYPEEARKEAVPEEVPNRYAPELSNTHWRLAEIQERGERISRPLNPAKYTFTFGADGIVLMQLNCNRARGSWNAQPQRLGPNGLAIGPLTMTHNICEPPSLDEQIAHDMEHVRSFSVMGDRLYLDLMLDGGTYVLERVEAFDDRRS